MDYFNPKKEDVFNIFRIIGKSLFGATNPAKVCMSISFILGILYFIAIGDMDYGYYTFLRVFSLVLIIIFMISLRKYSDAWDWTGKTPKKSTVVMYIITLIIAILFNPLFPIYSDKETWIVLDAISGTIMLVIFGFMWGKHLRTTYLTSLFVLRGRVVEFGRSAYNPNEFFCKVVTEGNIDPLKNILYLIDVDKSSSDLEIKKGDYIEVTGKLDYVSHFGGVTSAQIKKGTCYFPRRN